MVIQSSNYWPVADFARVLSPLFDADAGNGEAASAAWMPRVDVREEASRFLITADIPGVDPKDIAIDMDKGVLSIRGERKAEAAADDGQYTRVERARGAFERRFALPDSADADGIRATGKFGVLEIAIPKRPEATPRKIAIEVQ